MRTDDPLRYAAIEIVEVRTLRGYDRNARTHSDEQVAQLAAAIQRFGFTNSILADDDGVIIAGHGRMAAARRLGLDRVPCIRVTGLTHYAPGDVRRFGWNCWQAAKDHVSTGSFAADVQAGLWSLALADQSYIGGPGGETFWHTPGGINALLTVILKAVKPIALAQRRNTYEWLVPFEDIVASGFSTAWKARIEADDIDLPGGWAEGKVVSLTVKDSAGAGSYPKATIRIACCDGTGEAGGTGELTVGYTGQPWDRVAVAEFAGYPPAAGPVPGGEAYLENGIGDQLAYVAANDYRRDVPGRSDASANDPKQLLRKVPTKLIFAMNPIAGGSGI